MMLGISMTACSPKVNPEEVVANVNGTDIIVKDYEATLALYKINIEGMYGESVWDTEVKEGVTYKDEFKNIILDQMVDMEAVYQEADKKGLIPTDKEVEEGVKLLKEEIDKDAEFKKELEESGINDEFLKTQQKMDLTLLKFAEDFNKNTKISDEEMKKYYEEHKDEFYRDELKASHILISTIDDEGNPLSDKDKEKAKKEAEEVLKKIEEGTDFAELAKEYSDDTASAVQGGELDYFTKGDMVPEFEEAAYALKEGEVSEIVESQFGYHIIKLYEKIDEQTPYEDVKEKIKATLLEGKYVELITKISETAKVKKNEEIVKNIKF